MRHFVLACSIAILGLGGAGLADAPLTPISDLQRATNVTVQGTVERIVDEDEFRLGDGNSSVLAYVGPNRVPVLPGESVTVEGFVDDDPGALEIYARRLVRANGDEIRFEYRYD
jgi:uncharacterized protein YdeI (BOF family)